MEWQGPSGIVVSDDPDRVDRELVHRWLSEESYWAAGRSRELVDRSIDRSVVLGAYDVDGRQIGIARWVTDGATFGFLCDVFVDLEARGRSVGEFLVRVAVEHPEVRGLRLLMLGTRDAHGLYRKFGFEVVPDPGWWMELRPPG